MRGARSAAREGRREQGDPHARSVHHTHRERPVPNFWTMREPGTAWPPQEERLPAFVSATLASDMSSCSHACLHSRTCSAHGYRHGRSCAGMHNYPVNKGLPQPTADTQPVVALASFGPRGSTETTANQHLAAPLRAIIQLALDAAAQRVKS